MKYIILLMLSMSFLASNSQSLEKLRKDFYFSIWDRTLGIEKDITSDHYQLRRGLPPDEVYKP